MPRGLRKRQGAAAPKSVAETASTTPTTTATPVFSPAHSPSLVDTPATSDVDEDTKPKAEGTLQSVRLTRNRKRISSENDLRNGGAEERASKRRAVANRAYVAITAQAEKVQTPLKNDKGKGKARAVTPMSEGASEAERGYESRESSGTSGSEFVASEDESDDDKDDEIVMDAAVRLSLQTASSSASTSSARMPGPSPAAMLRAAAAERRLARNQRALVQALEEVNEDMDEIGSTFNSEDATSSLDSESDEEPLATKTASKKKAVVARKMAVVKTFKDFMAESELNLELRKAVKKEEQALAAKLGRRLTYAEKSTIALYSFHPELRTVWGDVEANIPVVDPVPAEQPQNLKLTLLPFQQESLFWMRKQEQGEWRGGMLADEMGMGKTIQIIALIVTTQQRPNLVIAPTVAIMQWKNEIEAHTDGLKVLVWHGASRESDAKQLEKFDIVLTTYAVLESCFRKQETGLKRKDAIIKEKSPLHLVHWNRIILDEAHNIKERVTNTAKATFELKSDFKWCLSGTPLQNRVGELYSLIRFLGGDPFAYYFCKRCDCKSLHWKFSHKSGCDDCGHSPMQHSCFWNNEILTPIQKSGMVGPGKTAFKKLKILLNRVMLRRTKLQRADDLGLPPRTVIVRRDYFSPEEKDLYSSLFSDAKRQFSTYLDQGTVLNNYSNIFSLLTRMRQMACHPDLVLRSKTSSTSFIPIESEATVCRLCNDFAEDAIRSKCHHIFDRECIRQYLASALGNTPDCPVCHVPLTIDLEAAALEIDDKVQNVRQGILGRLDLNTWRSSTKIEALIEELSNLRLKDATTKSIVFSQFVNFLDLIAYRLQRAGFSICRLEGTMSPQARDATIKHFMNNVDVTVFLVSLKAGGVALNLTEASRVYLMDSWWNPAVEYQAMDRIHRLGQRRPVHAIKIVVEDSIESRIVQLQEKKSAMVNATLSADDQAMGRLTPEDLSFLFRL